MPIFNVSVSPKQPTFHLGPANEIGQDSDTDGSTHSSGIENSHLSDIKNKMTSFLLSRKTIASASPIRSISSHRSLKKSNHLQLKQTTPSIGGLKRLDSIISSVSSSKYWAFRLSKNHRTLFFFKSNNIIRRIVVRITESSIFDLVIILLIILNCISLALDNPTNPFIMKQILFILEWIFTALFTIELIMKMIALGFVLHPGSYLRSPWNALDLFIVATSYLQLVPGFSNYSALRSLRALRPLRTVNVIPGLRIIVNALLQSIPPFINVLILLMFSFFMFGILGVQLLMGVLKNRCVVTDSSRIEGGKTLWDFAIDETGSEIICSTFWLGRSCPSSFEGKAVHCQTYASSNPFVGTLNFDHIGWGFMQIFQIYVGEEWTTSMYYYQDAWSHIIVVYFILVMFFGGFFALNLGLAVINDKFSHVNAITKKGGLSVKKRIIHKLKKRKVTAWLVRKLSWIDYKSNDSDSIESVEFSSDISDINSDKLSENKGKSFRMNHDKSKSISSSSSGTVISSPNKVTQNLSTLPPTNKAFSIDTSSDNSTEESQFHEFTDSDSIPIPIKQSMTINRTSFSIISYIKKRKISIGSNSNKWYFNIHKQFYKIFKRVRRLVNHLVNNPWFGRLILLIIVINMLIMAIEHHNQPIWITQISNLSNFIFVGIFTFEMFLKIFGMGISYFTDLFNALDILVVVSSYLDIIFSDFASFTALRSLRLLRVFKLLSWGSLRALTSTILNSMSSIFYLIIIYLLFLFTMSLIGMHTFTGKINTKIEPVQNFQDFIHSFLTVFQLTTKENWLNIYWNLMDANSNDFIQSIITILYMMVTIIIGDFIILNLFLAILIQTFEEDTKKTFELKSVKSRQSLKELFNNTNLNELKINSDSSSIKTGIKEVFKQAWRKVQSRRKIYKDLVLNKELNVDQVQGNQDFESEISPTTATTSDSSSINSIEYIFGDRHIMPLNGNSLFIFSPTNKLRLFIRKVIIHPITNYFFIACTFVSALLPSILGPYTDANSVLGQAVFWFTLILTCIFIIETLLKIFVQGLFVFNWKSRYRTGFLNDPWNVLDVIIITIDILYMSLYFTNIRFIRSLSAFTCLRFFTRVSSLKVVLNTLFRSIPSIINVLIVCCLIFIVFGILGVQLFKGKFYYCSTEMINTESDCLFPEGVNRTLDFIWNKYSSTCTMNSQFSDTIKTRSDCQTPMKWINNPYNFDNLLSSLLVLFEVASIEKWPDISGYAISAIGIDINPRPGYNIYVGFFFMIFVMIGAVFIINIFVGVVLSNFNRIKEEEDGALMLTVEQREWISTQRLFMKLKLIHKTMPPKNRLRKIIYLIITDVRFEYLISFIIVTNVIFMTIEFDQMPTLMVKILNISNIVFTVLFLIEALLKIIGLGLFQYFRDSWNIFDFIVVLLSIIGIIASSIETSVEFNPTFMRVFRVFRILRLVRLIKTTKQIRALLEMLYYSIPSMMNVLMTVALTCYIYAIIGMNLFYSMKMSKDIHHLAHFRGIFPSLLTMIRISTSENWNSIMRSLMNTSTCSGNDCGNSWLAIPFFVSFIIICTYVIMNLFIAVILDNFENQMKFEDSALNSSDLSRFTEIWSEMDPKATYMIKTSLLKNLLQRVGPPLGLPADCSRAELIRKLVSLDIPEHQGNIHFIETLIPLARRVYNVELPEKERKKIERNLFRRYKSLKKMKSTQGYTTGEYFAASYIQAAYKGRQVRRTGASIIGLELVRTQSGRLKFNIDRKCIRVAKLRALEKKEAGELSTSSESEDEIIQYRVESQFESSIRKRSASNALIKNNNDIDFNPIISYRENLRNKIKNSKDNSNVEQLSHILNDKNYSLSSKNLFINKTEEYRPSINSNLNENNNIIPDIKEISENDLDSNYDINSIDSKTLNLTEDPIVFNTYIEEFNDDENNLTLKENN